MKILITGGSGFIGSKLTDTFLQKGYQVTIIDLQHPEQNVPYFKLNLINQKLPTKLFTNVEVIIHLAGTNIFGRWNQALKKEIYDSRVKGARNLVSSIKSLSHKPAVFISASAVGYYGDRGDEELLESSPPGGDFLARLCVDWEKEVKEVKKLGVRTVQIRTAPVLGRDGMIEKMMSIYRLGLGGPLGDGNQWFPWIHIDDLVRIYLLALENQSIQGPINACSPIHIRNSEFSAALASVLHRPSLIKVPKWVLQLILGELGEIVVASQKVKPKKLSDFQYKFTFENIQSAFENLLGEGKR